MCAEGESLFAIWSDAVEALNNVVEKTFKMVSAGDHDGFRRTTVAVERAQREVKRRDLLSTAIAPPTAVEKSSRAESKTAVLHYLLTSSA
jgi:hypothetical protein